MSRICPNCDKESKNLKSRFCSDCGEPLPAIDSQEDELPEQGELKDQAEATPVDESQDQVEAAEVTRVLPESESPADDLPEAEMSQKKPPEETQEAQEAQIEGEERRQIERKHRGQIDQHERPEGEA